MIKRYVLSLFLVFSFLYGGELSVDSFISRLYKNIFQREADKTGLDYWREKFKEGETALRVAEFFYSSKEMKSLDLNDSEFIRRSYKTFLDREPDSEGERYWLLKLKNKEPRKEVFYGFAMSEEFEKLCSSYGIKAYDRQDLLDAFIERFYNYILNRESDFEGKSFWRERLLKKEKTPQDIVKSFFFSKEFLNKHIDDKEFLKIAYKTILSREPDSKGENFWLNELKTHSREYVLNSFLSSKEFENLSSRFLKEDDEESYSPKYGYDGKNYYKGLKLYSKNISYKDYKLPQLSDSEFNSFSQEKRLYIAKKLFSTLFYGMEYEKLKSEIESKDFISKIKREISVNSNDLESAQDLIENENYFAYPSWGKNEIYKILERFYVLPNLDREYINLWSAYILTQTIMFSPAYELSSSHYPNITRVYTRFVRNFRDNATIGYSAFLYMTSEDNWRRFRSPEDNAREMLEIFTMDYDDSHVPIAATALKNWKLDRDYDTLVIDLNENRKPLHLFGTTIYNGFDFYREMVKSDIFLKTVVKRIVDIFFPKYKESRKIEIRDRIVSSNPQTWQDILLQIVFSKEYLLNSQKIKSAEELFFHIAKSINYKNDKYLFIRFQEALENMGQASMKYKLGKRAEVPLDTHSFMAYHKFAREELLLKNVSDDKINNYDWGNNGWIRSRFLSDEHFDGVMFNEHEKFAKKLIDYLFLNILGRRADKEEMDLFLNHFLKDGKFNSQFDLFKIDNRSNAAVIILDYISRLRELYAYKRVGDE